MVQSVHFRPTSRDINSFLKKAPDVVPFKKGIVVKQLMRIALIENPDITNSQDKLLEYDKGDEEMLTRDEDLKPVYVNFNAGDKDIVDYLESSSNSKQDTIKRLVRIALINDPEVIIRSGLISDVEKTFEDNPYLLSIYRSVLNGTYQKVSKKEQNSSEKTSEKVNNTDNNQTSVNPDVKVNRISEEQMNKFGSFSQGQF